MSLLIAPSSAARVVFASEIGCILDCDLDTGLQLNTGGAATDNTAAINPVLATALKASPLHFMIDGPTADAGIHIPAVPYLEISGLGRGTGFFAQNGANSTALGNYFGAPFEQQTAPPAQAGSLILRDFRIEGNWAGNSTTGDHRGYVPSDFGSTTIKYCGIDLVNLAYVLIDNVHVHNAPLYALRITNCSEVNLRNYSVYNWQGTYPSVGNTDGVHISGPANNIRISGCNINISGDDAYALNAPEGYCGSISNVVISDTVIHGKTLLRVYCGTFTVTGVQFTDFVGQAQDCAFLLGIQNVPSSSLSAGGGTIAVDQIGDISIQNGHVVLESTGTVFLHMANSIGTLAMRNVVWASPQAAIPFLGLTNTGLNVSEMLLEDITIYRTPAGNALAGAFDPTYDLGFGTTNTIIIKRLIIDGFNIVDQAGQSYGAIPFLFRWPTGCSIGTLWIESLSPANITALVDSTYGFTNIGQVAGPGVLTCGFQIPDAKMALNTPYISATGANAGKMCIQHTAGTVIVLG